MSYILIHNGSSQKEKNYPYFEQVAEILIAKGYNVKWVENKTIKELVKTIKDCSIFIGNDSGPMHIADYYRKPIVLLIGPTFYPKNLPYFSKYVVVRNNFCKRGCYLKTYCGKCLMVDPMLIIRETEKLLKENY